MIAIPKHCFQMANLERQRDLAMFKVCVSEESYQSSKIDLEDLIQTILTLRKQTYDTQVLRLMDDMIAQCPLDMVNRLQPYHSNDMLDEKYRAFSFQKLVGLNRKLKFQLLDAKRREVAYEQNLEKAFFFEDLCDNQHSKERKIKSRLVAQRDGKCGSCLDRGAWAWHVKVKPGLCWVLGLLAIGMSLVLVAGEMVTLFRLDF